MKKYVFYTSDGFTHNAKGNEIENCQILGWVIGKNANEAFEELQKENKSIKDFNNICCQELANEKVYYF